MATHCNQALYSETEKAGNGQWKMIARCTEPKGTEHSHADLTTEEAIARGKARRV